MPTKQLLGRLKQLHRCEESLALSDRDQNEYKPLGVIEFKDSPEWLEEYDCLKELLATREHIPRKKSI